MKHKTIFVLFFVATSFFIFNGCECSSCTRYPMGFENNADYRISFYSIVIPPMDFENSIVYPDTSLPLINPQQIGKMLEIKPNGFTIYSETHAPVDVRYSDFNTDTISFFVFSTDTIEKYGWDSVRVSYNILQRYDISLYEFNALSNPFPSFPPCDAMRNIKMWPPYGTYDENGHRVAQ